MTTDREYLELAAKAAGEWPGPEPFEHVLDRWNPLTDDGDAFRLMVRLELYVKPGVLGVRVHAWDRRLSEEPTGDDSLAATRRAIVRAAAEIGRGMK